MIQNAKSFSCHFFVGINGVASVLRKIFSLMLPLILNLLSDLICLCADIENKIKVISVGSDENDQSQQWPPTGEQMWLVN